MTTATITSKGQITIPAIVRSELKVGPGDHIEFVKTSENRYEVIAATQDISEIRGMINTKKSVSIDEMNAAIRARKNQT